jgi:imidazoleglycerol-phosphate dehydratase
MRQAEKDRETRETRIHVAVNLDGRGECDAATGVGFFDHMLTHIAKHGLFDLTVRAQGDLEIDPHHTVEDVGIVLGQAVREAVGVPRGIRRYGHAVVPMDETLAEVAVDFSGRPFLVFQAAIPRYKLGEFDSELVEEFFRAFAMNSRVTLHVVLRYGQNVHHNIEGLFKAFGCALAEAVSVDPRVTDVPSTKGMLEMNS